MNNNTGNIEEVCGLSPEGVVYTDPGNDPNFVFTQDPSFETLSLYDVENNVINVNSWFECAHYVNGGWSNSQIIETFPGDKYIFFAAFALTALYGSYMYFAKMLNK